MLTLITGHVQSGKTAQLIGIVADFEAQGKHVFGLISPGVFNESGKKIAVNAELLPSHEVFQVGTKSEEGWDFDKVAVGKVNAHFAFLNYVPDVFVIDEIGPQELNNNAGFSIALSLLKVGPKVCGENAIVVIRHKLKDVLLEQIGNAWDEIKVVDVASS